MKNDNMKSLVYSMKNKQNDNEHFKLLIPGKEKTEAVCNWNEGISKSTLSDFQEITQWYFPEDFKEFLEVSNGCTLFTHPHNGGGVDILDLERIRRVHEEIIQIPDHWYPVAWTDFVAGAICIDSEKCKLGTKPYMYFLDAMEEVEEAIPLYCDFKTWFERLIICQGVEYWLWDSQDRM